MSEDLEPGSMSVRPAVLFVCLFACCLHGSAAAAQPAPPHNVTVITLNTNYTLSWEYDSNVTNAHSVTFTTQYLPKFKLKYKKKNASWITACNESSQRFCDLTVLNLHYLGIFVLRVRANVNRGHSGWVQKEFCPDKDAAVGPPASVGLVPVGSNLQVSISDPMTTDNRSMKEHLPGLYYNIRYWEHSEDASASVISSETNVVTLPDLKARTWYCVSLQSRCDFYHKSSSFTTPRCMQTEGAVPWWQIFLYFLGSLVICFLLILFALFGVFWVFKTVKATFYPVSRLPAHFQQCRHDSTGSDIPPLFTPDSESDLCEKVIVCPQPGLLEEEIPSDEDLLEHRADLPSDNSGELSCQASSSSGDTGIYSAEGCSSLYQPDSAQSVSGASDCCRVPFEQVKMGDIKGEALIAGGVVDMWI
ncbi:interferon alpha/beta receptor 1b-like [Salarias fasciatus]|uniref:Interferon alpha/beta receptor 1b-like n=1 Tax=Salarias fasciatus TaxID=181472 RepID=A0A672HVI5_SALFA|nr:interferon alpha/beta receptor 1b-like [Salarias fasciatus]